MGRGATKHRDGRRKGRVSRTRGRTGAVHHTKIYKQGNSLGVRIPKQLIEELGFRPGDPVHLRLVEGRIEITRADDTYTRALEIGRAFGTRYYPALARLAPGHPLGPWP